MKHTRKVILKKGVNLKNSIITIALVTSSSLFARPQFPNPQVNKGFECYPTYWSQATGSIELKSKAKDMDKVSSPNAILEYSDFETDHKFFLNAFISNDGTNTLLAVVGIKDKNQYGWRHFYSSYSKFPQWKGEKLGAEICFSDHYPVMIDGKEVNVEKIGIVCQKKNN